jgi:hypothetical protein
MPLLQAAIAKQEKMTTDADLIFILLLSIL